MPKRKSSRKRKTSTYALLDPFAGRGRLQLVVIACNDPRCSCDPDALAVLPLPADPS